MTDLDIELWIWKRQELEQPLVRYLISIKDEASKIDETGKITALAYHCWYLCVTWVHQKTTQTLKIPDCVLSGIDPLSCIRYMWDSDEHYLSCEIYKDGTLEFFYKNRFTNEDWSEDSNIYKKNFSDKLLDKLTLFVE